VKACVHAREEKARGSISVVGVRLNITTLCVAYKTMQQSDMIHLPAHRSTKSSCPCPGLRAKERNVALESVPSLVV
jgi:hypothetical protein